MTLADLDTILTLADLFYYFSKTGIDQMVNQLLLKSTREHLLVTLADLDTILTLVDLFSIILAKLV